MLCKFCGKYNYNDVKCLFCGVKSSNKHFVKVIENSELNEAPKKIKEEVVKTNNKAADASLIFLILSLWLLISAILTQAIRLGKFFSITGIVMLGLSIILVVVSTIFAIYGLIKSSKYQAGKYKCIVVLINQFFIIGWLLIIFASMLSFYMR